MAFIFKTLLIMMLALINASVLGVEFDINWIGLLIIVFLLLIDDLLDIGKTMVK